METLKSLHIKNIDLWFWHEIDKEIVLKSIKSLYKIDAIEWIAPTDLIVNWNKILIRWDKEFNNL